MAVVRRLGGLVAIAGFVVRPFGIQRVAVLGPRLSKGWGRRPNVLGAIGKVFRTSNLIWLRYHNIINSSFYGR